MNTEENLQIANVLNLAFYMLCFLGFSTYRGVLEEQAELQSFNISK